jgi:hypothetical protein
MNQIDLNIVKAQVSRKVVIDHITLSDGEKPHLWFSDCDSMTDYFHGYHATIKETIEELKTRGSDSVRIDVNYSFESDPEGKELERMLRKINKIAKESGYINKVKIEERIDHGYQKQEIRYMHVGGTIERMYEGVN